jgi:peptidoglycan/xylan/chitin deacetylase (PgdA/CDA1 family)
MKVILKADDFGGIYFKPGYPWAKFIDVITANGVKTSLGVIGKNMVNATVDQIKELKALHKKGVIEFYNHSFNHMEYFPGRNSHYKEFSGTLPEYQVKSLMDCQEIIKARFGYTMPCFGAPQNSMDDHALNLLNEHPEIKYIYAYQNSLSFPTVVKLITKKKLILLNGYGILENKTHTGHVDFTHFKKRFYEVKNFETVTFQMHPSPWIDKDRDELDKIIKFLKEYGCVFVTPSQL